MNMRTTRGWLVAPLALGCLLGCDGAAEGCGDCGEGEFCCVDTCQPFGSTCRAGDAAVDADAAVVDARTVDPCAPPEPGADVAYACQDDSVYSCSDRERLTVCNLGYECAEWLDPVTDEWVANCLSEGEAPCDPGLVEPHCEGTSTVRCDPRRREGGSPPTPVGIRSGSDCTDRLGSDAVCIEEGDEVRCELPGAETCEVGRFTPTCTDGGGIRRCVDGFVVPGECGVEGTRCFDTSSWGGRCLPSSAVPSAEATESVRNIECAGESRIRRQRYGYEWVEDCEPQVVVGGPDVPTVCYDETGMARCEPPDTEHCDPDTYEPSCSDDLTTSTYCSGDTVYTAPCRTASEPGLCDPSTGRCFVPEICASGFHEPTCVADGQWRSVCGEDDYVEYEPCPGCVEEGGSARCP